MSSLRTIEWGYLWLGYKHSMHFGDAVQFVYRYIKESAEDPTDTAILLVSVLPFADILQALKDVTILETSFPTLDAGIVGTETEGTVKGFQPVLQQIYGKLGMLPINDRHELIGEIGASLVATALGLLPTGFVKRKHGPDDILGDGALRVIVEAKGGLARLRACNKMSF